MGHARPQPAPARAAYRHPGARARRPALLPVHDGRPHRPGPPRALPGRDSHGGGPRRPRGLRRLARRQCDLHARLPRGVRARRPLGLGRRPRSAARRSRGAEHAKARRRSPTSSPTSTRCASASTASGSSTTGCGSSRGLRPDRSPMRRRRARAASPRRRRRRANRATALELLYDRLVPGGLRRRGALRRVRLPRRGRRVPRRARHRRPARPCRLDRRLWRKHDAEAPCRASRRRARRSRRERAPLAARRPGRTALDLSVVVVFHNMRREAQRTLHSLSRAYQQEVDDLDYEVIVDRERLARTISASARTSCAGSARSSATWTSAPTRRRRRRPRSTAGSRVARRGAGADDRRRPRADAGRPAFRHRRPADLCPGDRDDASVVPRARASRARRSTPATTRSTRTGCSSRSTGRSTATGCSRSATSSATATGSTACGRATACSCRAPLLEQVGGVRRVASRCPAAATRTSTCSSASARRRG